MTTTGIALCPVCANRMSGSGLIDLSDVAELTGIYLLHLIDEHWDLVKRIRATTGHSAMREILLITLTREMT